MNHRNVASTGHFRWRPTARAIALGLGLSGGVLAQSTVGNCHGGRFNSGFWLWAKA